MDDSALILIVGPGTVALVAGLVTAWVRSSRRRQRARERHASELAAAAERASDEP